MRKDFVVYYYGINDWHDAYHHDGVAEGKIVKIAKKEADSLGATGFTINEKRIDWEHPQPLAHYDKENGRWVEKW